MEKKTKKTLKTFGIIFLLATALLFTTGIDGCMNDTPTEPTTQKVEQNTVEDNQKILTENQPMPTITKSLERENIINRLKLLNDENKVFYVYLISYGKVMAFYTAKGKVTSLNSYINSQQRVIRDENCVNDYGGGNEGRRACYFVIDTPDIDGSYGENADGVFFFTTEGAYVEWKGEYMVSDYPLKLSTPPELVRNI
jgi:hypothetical protein